MPGTLYLVATPIGNLEDFTFRAVRTLREAGLIACEDTRHTRRLLDHYAITTPLISYHEHNERERAEELTAKLLAGLSVALVSDAGMPLVADPGYRLVAAAIEKAIPVVPIPGPAALVTALAASGLPTDALYFGGFLPFKSGQRVRALEPLRHIAATLIFYEAPHRILDTLSDIEKVLGARHVVVGRELTKVHEEFLRGPVMEVRAALAARPAIKGEITLLIGRHSPDATAEAGPVDEAVARCMREGLSRMDAMKAVARQRGLSKRDIYRSLEQK